MSFCEKSNSTVNSEAIYGFYSKVHSSLTKVNFWLKTCWNSKKFSHNKVMVKVDYMFLQEIRCVYVHIHSMMVLSIPSTTSTYNGTRFYQCGCYCKHERVIVIFPPFYNIIYGFLSRCNGWKRIAPTFTYRFFFCIHHRRWGYAEGG